MYNSVSEEDASAIIGICQWAVGNYAAHHLDLPESEIAKQAFEKRYSGFLAKFLPFLGPSKSEKEKISGIIESGEFPKNVPELCKVVAEIELDGCTVSGSSSAVILIYTTLEQLGYDTKDPNLRGKFT